MDDLISRQAAIDALMEILDKPKHAEFLYRDEIYRALMTLPSAQPEITEAQVKEYCEKRCLVVLSADAFHRLKSAQPERKKGRWIGKPIAGYCTVRCSVCNNVFRENSGRWSFCPNCGADMREEEDADD